MFCSLAGDGATHDRTVPVQHRSDLDYCAYRTVEGDWLANVSHQWSVLSVKVRWLSDNPLSTEESQPDIGCFLMIVQCSVQITHLRVNDSNTVVAHTQTIIVE